ncbi:hypothetical protein IC582_007149 [Cucumis melo]
MARNDDTTATTTAAPPINLPPDDGELSLGPGAEASASPPAASGESASGFGGELTGASDFGDFAAFGDFATGVSAEGTGASLGDPAGEDDFDGGGAVVEFVGFASIPGT